MARHWPESEGLEARALTVAAVVAGAVVVGGIASADAQRKAGNRAADAQQAAAQSGMVETQRQFDATQALLKPWATAGTGALTGQQDLAGLNGVDAQAAAVKALQGSPQFTSMLQQGENSILQNAAATGGLRGGNTQGALAQFSPQLLAQTINDQYGKLGSISQMGLGAATQTGVFGANASNNVSNLMQQQGAARAGMFLNQGKQTANMWNSVSNGIGAYFGAGGKF